MSLFTTPQNDIANDSLAFRDVNNIEAIPTFNTLLNKHIPAQNTEVFNAAYFWLEPTTLLKEAINPVNAALIRPSSTNYATYDPVLNKERSVSATESTQIPIVERREDYTAYREVIPKVLYHDISRPANYISSSNWITLVLLGIVLFLGYTRISFGRFTAPLFKASFIPNQANRIYFEKSVVIGRLFGIFDWMFVITLSLVLSLTANYWGYSLFKFPHWLNFLLFMAAVAVLSLIKRIINRLIGYFLDIQDVVHEFTFHSNLYTKFTALLFLPFVITLPYVSTQAIEPMLLIMFWIAMLVYLFRLIRLIQITRDKRFSNFYLFLYLCTVEIGPMVIMASLFRQFF